MKTPVFAVLINTDFNIMEILSKIFGEGKDLNIYQMCLRAIVIFFITLFLIRVSGRRSFGMRSPFDNIIVILLGAILSRTIVGASEFLPTISAAFVIVFMHRLFAWIAMSYQQFGAIIEGEKIILYENGILINGNMKKALLSEKDLYESLRKTLNMDSLENIKCAYMECNGEISFIKKT